MSVFHSRRRVLWCRQLPLQIGRLLRLGIICCGLSTQQVYRASLLLQSGLVLRRGLSSIAKASFCCGFNLTLPKPSLQQLIRLGY
jgi:hypothetical protein